MDPQRIEEFRRKLREGRPVRVVGGQVVLDGATPGPPGTPPPPIPNPPLPPPGVQVKPHEWGAVASAPFYATTAGQTRALKEQALLATEYPGFVMDIDDDGTPFSHGWIGPNDQLGGSYHVLLVLPPGYGQGVMPSVHVLEPPVAAGAPHLYVDGSLCLDHSGAFTRKSTLLTALAWVSVWLVLYEGWRTTGIPW
jgi:hypothetical protein